MVSKNLLDDNNFINLVKYQYLVRISRGEIFVNLSYYLSQYNSNLYCLGMRILYGIQTIIRIKKTVR